MKASVPALAPILRSNLQGDLLALLFLHPEDEFSQAELARSTGGNPSQIHREIRRLVTSAVLEQREVSPSKPVRANTGYELYAPLSEIVLRTYGPRAVLGELVRDIPGLEFAAIYGSWAARYVGEVGRPPNDVDVLMVGDVDFVDIDRVASEAEARLRREVNITRATAERWRSSDEPFYATLRTRPIVQIFPDSD